MSSAVKSLRRPWLPVCVEGKLSIFHNRRISEFISGSNTTVHCNTENNSHCVMVYFTKFKCDKNNLVR